MSERGTAIQALLKGIVDYAGLFPPASLDMPTAVRNYAGYLTGEHSWLLGRLVVPAQRLGEFTAAFAETCCTEQASPWLLSVLSTGDAAEDARLLEPFSEGAAYLDALELKCTEVAQVEAQVGGVPSGMGVYVEFPPEKSEEFLPVLKKLDARAKIRTGGVTADAIPSSETIASFLVACAKEKVAFKATAGLHHPLRAVQRLTYEDDSATAVMHGFINVFVAAAVAYQGGSLEVRELLDEQSDDVFQWNKGTLKWRNYKLSTKQISAAREKFANGFGSCSFSDPINDLKALGWL